jgi:hypothetical protein
VLAALGPIAFSDAERRQLDVLISDLESAAPQLDRHVPGLAAGTGPQGVLRWNGTASFKKSGTVVERWTSRSRIMVRLRPWLSWLMLSLVVAGAFITVTGDEALAQARAAPPRGKPF